MYEQHFGFERRPFSIIPESELLYLTPQHTKALASIEYSLSGQGGLAVVTGEVGGGKTTLIRKFLSHLPADVEVGLISNTHTQFGDLLQWVLHAFDLPAEENGKVANFELLREFLNECNRERLRAILVVDEAQNLSDEALEELRLLSNFNVEGVSSLQIVLVGQPELLESLRRPQLRQLRQRVSTHFNLKPLPCPETFAYIHHRTLAAGGTTEIFDDLAIAGIYVVSNGVPRLINSVCDMCLVHAYADESNVVSFETLVSVIVENRDTVLLGPNGVGCSPDIAKIHESAISLNSEMRAEIEKAKRRALRSLSQDHTNGSNAAADTGKLENDPVADKDLSAPVNVPSSPEGTYEDRMFGVSSAAQSTVMVEERSAQTGARPTNMRSEKSSEGGGVRKTKKARRKRKTSRSKKWSLPGIRLTGQKKSKPKRR